MELLINYCKIKGFRTVPTIHCKQSYGIVITYINDIKISYSGDTRPSPWFIEASKNCDVMIHEATFPNNLQQNAEDFLHSTIKEAVESGIKANCWRVILTHFSQRMQKGVNEKSTTEKNEEFYENYLKYNTITAYDHLRSKVSQLKELPFYSKEIGKLFPSED
jgi:ribonuclease Z